MPFYWRLSHSPQAVPGIAPRLGIRLIRNQEFDYLEYAPTAGEWETIELAYRQNENIGFVNPESGQIHTYGSSVNNFFLETAKACSPERIYEIGCGAGFSIAFLKEHGWTVTGIDPSEYSRQWSERLGFALLNTTFQGDLLAGEADLVYCNDVFEHIPRVEQFSREVYQALRPGGVFCFATTNSTQSISIGDISMLEHQHVNMFTTRSIYLILASAGFSEITIQGGSYGNTFQVVARKGGNTPQPGDVPPPICGGFFARAQGKLAAFEAFYQRMAGACQYYVPLRCLPYLAAVGDFGASDIFDSNPAWRGKYIDGYGRAIKSAADLPTGGSGNFFIGSLTFYEEIKQTLRSKGFPDRNIFSISSLEDEHKQA